MRLAIALVLAGVCAAAASAAEPLPPKSSKCAVTGESIDADPKGLRVHKAPSLSSAEVGRLYPGMDPHVFFHDEKPSLAEGLVGAMFTVDAVQGDWLHIIEVDPVTDGLDPNGGLELIRNFEGAGWVHASQVRLSPTRWEKVFAEPREGGPPLAGNWWNGRIVGCRGNWAQVRSAEGSLGWLPSPPNTERAAKISHSLRQQGLAN